MKRSRYSEEQIIGILKQHEAGVKTEDLCREHVNVSRILLFQVTGRLDTGNPVLRVPSAKTL